MLVVLSPAKKLDKTLQTRGLPVTQPQFVPQMTALLDLLRPLHVIQMRRLMGISEALARLNMSRFRDFALPLTVENAAAAVFLFRGDTYAGLDADNLGDDDLVYAQDYVRILSGFYGLLRPLDLIQPYRLEMAARLPNPKGETLYDFWGPLLAEQLERDLDGHEVPVVVNCASFEYFKAVTGAQARGALKQRVVTPVFKEEKDGVARIISFAAKRARGMMARYLIRNRITQPAAMKDFNEAGYRFQPGESDDNTYVFIRPRPWKSHDHLV